MKFNLKYGLVALAGLGLSANVAAVDYTCSDITFTPDAFDAYEFVDQACLDIIERDGAVWVKLTSRVVAQTSSGTHFRFRHADGELGPNNKAGMRADFDTRIDGQPVMLQDVAVRTDVNVYLSQAYWSPPPPPVEEVVEAAPPPPPPPAPEPEPEPEPEMLPTTASNLPWLALFGALFLVLGGALRFSRR